MFELLNGNTYTFYVSDVFYNDIELTSGKFVQVNYIKDDVIYGTTINGEQIRLNSDDSSIKYKNFKTNSKNDTESEESAESEDIYQHDTDNQEQLQSGYKDVDHTDLVFETLSKEDKDTLKLMMEFLENGQNEEIAEKYELRPGVGLAAPQINISKRMLAVFTYD